MKTKMMITAAFAALTLGTASWAMATDNKNVTASNDVTTTKTSAPAPTQTACKCSGITTDLEKKAQDADKKSAEADKSKSDADVEKKTADDHYEYVKDHEDNYTHDQKKEAKKAKEKADQHAIDEDTLDTEAHTSKDVADKAFKAEKNGGACVCPNGSTSYQYNVTPGSANGSAPTSAFREVRGQ